MKNMGKKIYTSKENIVSYLPGMKGMINIHTTVNRFILL